MTTKLKIILGFTTMILLIVGVSTLGYKGMEDASSRFIDYRRLARLDVDLSDTLAEVNSALAKTHVFVSTRNLKDMEEALKATDTARGHIENALKEITGEENRKKLGGALSAAAEFKTILQEVRASMETMNKQYYEQVIPIGLHFAKSLDEVVAASRDLGDVAMASLTAEAWSQYGLYLSGMSRFVFTRADADAKTVREREEQLTKTLLALEQMIRTPRGKEVMATLMTSHAELLRVFKDMQENAKKANASMANLEMVAKRGGEVIGGMNSIVTKTRADRGTEILEANVTAQQNMLISSIVGVLLGLFLTVITVRGILGTIAELLHYAKAVAVGDFSRRLSIREKGEVGAMVDAMKAIPEVLQRVIGDAGKLSNAIRIGKMRERLDVKNFEGSFADLALAVNTVSDAYSNAIDALPVALMACDKDCNTLFFNTSAKKLTGTDTLNTHCKTVFGAPECDSVKCFGKRTIASGASVQGETTVVIQGKSMDIAVNTMALRNAEGELAGFFEVLTDLTAIKSQQRTMQQVATQASEISSRVAAASEQLAAQVEQISHGAEVQRERVESTASAMTEMNATVLEVAKSAGEGSKQSEDTRLKASEGAELVNRVMGSISTVNTIGQNLQTNMQELGKQAESIGTVLNVISDIADQTNLLALNAAIEAARAGEAGRGFAVVADEVRKLAEKTMAATQEVGASISAVQRSVHTNIQEVGQAVQSVAEANDLAKSSGQVLNEILNMASANSAIVTSIATAAEEQSSTSEEISQAITEINQIVGETTEGMVQSSSAVQDLSRMAQELRRVMENLH